jgi:DNA modification methylase/superfamily II DNA or RNA helicase
MCGVCGAERAGEKQQMVAYQQFLDSKRIRVLASGIEPGPINPMLFPVQRDIVRWCLRKGRAAIFADCGLGKSFMQLEWARQIPGKVLILAPLAVAPQTVREGKKLGIEVVYARQSVDAQITIANYEMLDHFRPSDYAGIVLDESSILKSFEGKFKNAIVEDFHATEYKLECTATPSPNDYMELGNHSEFLGNLTRTEMLSTFFVHDGGDTSKWRLKGHAQKDFWKWVCSWAVMIRKPSDLGYDDAGFILPELTIHERTVEVDRAPEGALFALPAVTLQERQRARSGSTDERAAEVARIAAMKPDEQWLIWTNLNSESNAAAKLIPGAVEVCGSDSSAFKEKAMLDFAQGNIRVLVSKPSICGFGLNFQSCHNVVFLGLSDSYEQFYQAIRRCWRFGQKSPVDCYIVTSTGEGEVVANIKRKEADAQKMAEEMVNNMHDLNQAEIHGQSRKGDIYIPRMSAGRTWTLHCADTVEKIKDLRTDSVHYQIYSPPFASLYTYSASERDMGNCRTHAEFYEHFRFLAPELLRILKPGRLMSFHCMNLPTSKERDGVIGISDFRGELIRIFKEVGFIFHSEVCIWKDPVTAMQRTKALGLLHKQLKKDACMSRQGIPDYLVTMRKPGENLERVTNTNESFPVQVWQRYASPVWMDINPSNTLNKEGAREDEDERHICPLQLEVIERGIRLWTNEGDTVFSPYAGIGSEGYQAVKMGRQFIGCELKESYWKEATANLKAAEMVNEHGLFAAQ